MTRWISPSRALPAGAALLLAAGALGAQGANRLPPKGALPAPRPVPPPAMASVDPALFRGLQYRLVGHSRGGRVTTVTGVPSQPKTFYLSLIHI